jgi:hypothetical protein
MIKTSNGDVFILSLWIQIWKVLFLIRVHINLKHFIRKLYVVPILKTECYILRAQPSYSYELFSYYVIYLYHIHFLLKIEILNMTTAQILAVSPFQGQTQKRWPCRSSAVRRWLLTAAARVRVRAACGVCGGQSGTGAGFLRVLRFSLAIIPPISPLS